MGERAHVTGAIDDPQGGVRHGGRQQLGHAARAARGRGAAEQQRRSGDGGVGRGRGAVDREGRRSVVDHAADAHEFIAGLGAQALPGALAVPVVNEAAQPRQAGGRGWVEAEVVEVGAGGCFQRGVEHPEGDRIVERERGHRGRVRQRQQQRDEASIRVPDQVDRGVLRHEQRPQRLDLVAEIKGVFVGPGARLPLAEQIRSDGAQVALAERFFQASPLSPGHPVAVQQQGGRAFAAFLDVEGVAGRLDDGLDRG